MNALRPSWDFAVDRETCVNIHPTAVVAREAEIGANVKIGPYAVIGPLVRLGPDNSIGAHAVIEGATTIGQGNTFSPHCYVGTPPQYENWSGAPQRLTIGDGNFIREFASISGGAFGAEHGTVIGDGNMLMAYTHVGHDSVLANGIRMVNNATLGGHSVVESYAWMAGLTAAHQKVRIGRNAFVALGATVTQDVPPFCIVQGDRARLVGLNEVGLKRANFTSEDVAALRRAFRALFLGKGPMAERMEKARTGGAGNPYVTHLVSFLENSERGFISTTRRAG